MPLKTTKVEEKGKKRKEEKERKGKDRKGKERKGKEEEKINMRNHHSQEKLSIKSKCNKYLVSDPGTGKEH